MAPEDSHFTPRKRRESRLTLLQGLGILAVIGLVAAFVVNRLVGG